MRVLCLLFLAIALQSCFFASIGRNPRWTYAADSQNTTAKVSSQTAPQVQVEVLRDQRWIPFPLVIIAADKKHYALQFQIRNQADLYQQVDSITYTLSDLQKNPLSQGKVLPKDGQLEKLEESKFYFQASGKTPYNLQLPKHLQESLTIQFTLYLKDHNGQVATEQYLHPLAIETPSLVRVHAFRN